MSAVAASHPRASEAPSRSGEFSAEHPSTPWGCSDPHSVMLPHPGAWNILWLSVLLLSESIRSAAPL